MLIGCKRLTYCVLTVSTIAHDRTHHLVLSQPRIHRLSCSIYFSQSRVFLISAAKGDSPFFRPERLHDNKLNNTKLR